MSILLWLLARPKVVAGVLAAAALLYMAHWLYAALRRLFLRFEEDAIT